MNLPPTETADDADRILLVDDDPTNLDILRQTLDGHGYRLLVATSGEDALRAAFRARRRSSSSTSSCREWTATRLAAG